MSQTSMIKQVQSLTPDSRQQLLQQIHVHMNGVRLRAL